MTADGVHPRRRDRIHLAEGFSLVELVMALALLALALGGIYALVVAGGRSAKVTNDFLQAQAQVRAAIDSVVAEARWAQAVTAAGPDAVTLSVPGDTLFSPGPYAVTFSYDSAAGTLTRRVGAAPAEVLAFNIVREDGGAGVVFEYFTAGGASLGSAPADLSAIARVRVTVVTTVGDVSRTFAADAALRAYPPPTP
ncbi:MAG: prepilin-type N-terminal cleavage/methylation domain-containing protein [Armatimonadota bacterium]|nr:prepilin-type N-terminal cleavage/methylation domain-containing protein [Armatimonadota bacterium]MDR7428140.1 prepilin-type N-terminal cleavage/methylation domain-containing protein [Armatimonadota bacterium]MDR7463712.1 prepilin-type N-terminal cleavage/methylation domain-containing protein [Armatimonadota bacterium]MDR7470195.1 prepilin-type N-terminal cleavage/methylation domain-containing protein [Armatimonadota bacterium]MDR7473623.1 prepilin-type N-terminal cleavage/methylation domain